jgi:hypothetical protein
MRPSESELGFAGLCPGSDGRGGRRYIAYRDMSFVMCALITGIDSLRWTLAASSFTLTLLRIRLSSRSRGADVCRPALTRFVNFLTSLISTKI